MLQTTKTQAIKLKHRDSIGLQVAEDARALLQEAAQGVIKAQHLLGSTVRKRPEVAELNRRIEAVAASLSGATAELAAIVAADRQAEMVRLATIEDSGLWRAAVDRQFGLVDAIKLAEDSLARLIHPEDRHIRLTQAGVSKADADKVCPPPPQADIDAALALIDGLRDEQASIARFLADKPGYRTELLRGAIADTAAVLLGQRQDA